MKCWIWRAASTNDSFSGGSAVNVYLGNHTISAPVHVTGGGLDVDVAGAQQRILDAGLPPILAERLALGR